MKIALIVALGLSSVAAFAGDSGQSGSDELHQTMMKGSKGMESMPMSGDTDRDFVMGMKMHHEQAIEMSKIELREAKDPKAKEFARRVIAAQKKEIAEFDRWLSEHPEKGMSRNKGMMNMKGMETK